MKKVLENILENQLNEVVNAVLTVQPLPTNILLRGNLGSGKTTLVKKLVKALGSEDAVSSPTFALVNEYATKEGNKIFHADWYRLQSMEELIDAGILDYIDSKELLLVEWPEIGMELLEGIPALTIDIENANPGRTYTITSE